MLSKFSEAIRSNISKNHRLKIVGIVTVEVHARDIIEKLIKSGCNDVTSFEWLSQLRLYWDRVRTIHACVHLLSFAPTKLTKPTKPTSTHIHLPHHTTIYPSPPTPTSTYSYRYLPHHTTKPTKPTSTYHHIPTSTYSHLPQHTSSNHLHLLLPLPTSSYHQTHFHLPQHASTYHQTHIRLPQHTTIYPPPPTPTSTYSYFYLLQYITTHLITPQTTYYNLHLPISTSIRFCQQELNIHILNVKKYCFD